MKTINYLLFAGTLILFSAFTINNAFNWKVAKDHSVKFAGTDAEGIFQTLSGDVKFDQNDLVASEFSFTVDVKSINTGNGMKNKHAISDKWFDAEKFPSITFVSQKIAKENNQFVAKGKLQIHGVTKDVSIPFSFIDNTIKAKFSVNRMDFKVGTMEGMSKKVSDKIDLNVSIPLTK